MLRKINRIEADIASEQEKIEEEELGIVTFYRGTAGCDYP